MTINVNSLLTHVSTKSDEGDAIDSNGKLIINGGTIYAFANSTSPDAGLDSSNGIYINNGLVISTGNMVDQISSDSKQKYLYASFNQINADTLIVIKNQKNEIITAFKTSRNIQNLLYSSSDLNYKSYEIYTGGKIDGEEINGLYTKINSYTDGEKITFRDVIINTKTFQNNYISNIVLIILIVEIVLLGSSITLYILKNKNK